MVGTATDTVLLPTGNSADKPGNRQVAALYSDHYRHVLRTVHDTIGPGEAGCCRQVAALYSGHYRQVLLFMILLDQGRLAAVDRRLPCTVATIDRFYCT